MPESVLRWEQVTGDLWICYRLGAIVGLVFRFGIYYEWTGVALDGERFTFGKHSDELFREAKKFVEQRANEAFGTD